MSTDTSGQGLDTHFNIVKTMVESIVASPSQGGYQITQVFGLIGKVDDEEHRNLMIAAYRAALEETTPMLAERLPGPVRFNTPEAQAIFESASAIAIRDAMIHITSILEGTHKWSPILAKNDPRSYENPEIPARHFSSARIVLKTAMVEPHIASIDMFFVALLIDREDTTEGGIGAKDTDPSVD